jgi:hypothetical protein
MAEALQVGHMPRAAWSTPWASPHSGSAHGVRRRWEIPETFDLLFIPTVEHDYLFDWWFGT